MKLPRVITRLTEVSLELRSKFGGAEWFGDETIGPKAQSLGPPAVVDAEHDHRRTRRFGFAFQLEQEFHPVFAFECDVEQNECWVLLSERLEAFSSGGSLNDLHVQIVERQLDELRHLRLVVDYQNRFHSLFASNISSTFFMRTTGEKGFVK